MGVELHDDRHPSGVGGVLEASVHGGTVQPALAGVKSARRHGLEVGGGPVKGSHAWSVSWAPVRPVDESRVNEPSALTTLPLSRRRPGVARRGAGLGR